MTTNFTARRTGAGLILSALLLVAAMARADGAGSANHSAGPAGVLCLRKLPASIRFASEGKGSAGIGYDDTTGARARRMGERPRLAVSVDGSAAVFVDQKRGGCIAGLALDVPHVARVSHGGGRDQAARFSFAHDPNKGQANENVLELHYDPFYGKIRIQRLAAAATVTTEAQSCAACANGSGTMERSPESGAPSCRSFGGLIHGVSSCVRVDLRSGRIAPLAQRVGGPGSTSLACDSTARVAGHLVVLKCVLASFVPGAVTRRVEISVSIDHGRPIAIDTHEGYWDFINMWVKADNQAAELTIDYGVLD